MSDFLAAQSLLSRNMQQIRNNRIEDQEIQRRNEFQAENQNLSRIGQIIDILKLGGHPVNTDGTVQTNLQPGQQQEASNAGIVGLQRLMQDADPARTVAVGGNRYMLPTQNDIFQQAINQKRIASQQSLEEYGQRQRMDDASSLDKAKQLFDYQQSEKQRLLAQQPKFDPANPMASPVPMDNLSGFAQAMGILFPEFKALNNYSTNDTTMTRVNRVNGNLETRVVPDAIGSRPRQGSAAGGSGGKAPTITQKADEFIAQVQQESNAKGGNRPEDYLRNVDQFYQHVPASVKARARSYFRGLAKSKPSAEGQQGAQPTQQQPAPAAAPITAINPQTGQKIVLKDGKWVAM